MGIELNCLKDLSTISMSIVELAAVNRVMRTHISNAAFLAEYDSLLSDICDCYQVVTDNLQPLMPLLDEARFTSDFDERWQAWSQSYLTEISKPRESAECTYEKYLQFRKLKEVNTGFPLLKRSFSRLHDYIDKWLDNDIWLAMYIDSLFKMTTRLLSEVAATRSRDVEDAWCIYHSGLQGYVLYLAIITDALAAIRRSMNTAGVAA